MNIFFVVYECFSVIHFGRTGFSHYGKIIWKWSNYQIHIVLTNTVRPVSIFPLWKDHREMVKFLLSWLTLLGLPLSYMCMYWYSVRTMQILVPSFPVRIPFHFPHFPNWKSLSSFYPAQDSSLFGIFRCFLFVYSSELAYDGIYSNWILLAILAYAILMFLLFRLRIRQVLWRNKWIDWKESSCSSAVSCGSFNPLHTLAKPV